MPNRIEPPILLSRLLTFVFAASLVILGALIVTIANLYPLKRPQVFILSTQPRNDVETVLQELSPDDVNIETYKRYFIMEYIKARNEILTDAQLMRRKWDNSEYGTVRNWSTDSVFADFTNTTMWTAMMNDLPEFEFRCPVEFPQGAVSPYSGKDTYSVRFSYFCTNNNGQSARKDYTITIRLEFDSDRKMKWADRMNNPLGVRVAEYSVQSGNGDPLNGFGGGK